MSEVAADWHELMIAKCKYLYQREKTRKTVCSSNI